jgi:hypothetical protein
VPDNRIAHQLGDLPAATQQVVAGLRDGLAELFRDDLAAIWLYGGSLFSTTALDIDLHILLRREPTTQEHEAIRRLHDSVSRDERWVDELDTWYILLRDAHKPEPPPNVGAWNPGARDEHWALHRAHWLAGACIVVHGLAPREVVLEPAWEELAAVLRHELVAEARDGNEPGSACSPYWTLQLCRVLASLGTHDVVRSKLDSGAWALRRLPSETHAIIEAAIRYYSRQPVQGDDELVRDAYPDFYAAVRPLIEAAMH